MNNLFNDISVFLPKYLSTDSTKELLATLKEFPNTKNDRFYTRLLKDKLNLFQGDGVKNLPIINLPNPKIEHSRCLILSNTCDISIKNIRKLTSNICYSPIIRLKNYENLLERQNVPPGEILNHINDLKSQKITQIFFLPKGECLEDDCMVFLDKINNISIAHLTDDTIIKDRFLTLSDYGFYLLLLKISIHFSRIHEKVDRFSGNIL